MIDRVIFDLDGTLVDSAPVCTIILNDMLAERGFGRRLTAKEVKPWLSRGGTHMVRNLLGEAGGVAERDIEEFRARYAHAPTPADCLFDGVREGLGKLTAAGFACAIASNKPQNLCEKVLVELRLGHFFEVVIGRAGDRRAKPDPHLLELAVEKLGVRKSQCAYVGDSDLDSRASMAAGLPFMMVEYGYHSEVFVPCALGRFNSFAEVILAIIGLGRRSPLLDVA